MNKVKNKKDLKGFWEWMESMGYGYRERYQEYIFNARYDSNHAIEASMSMLVGFMIEYLDWRDGKEPRLRLYDEYNSLLREIEQDE